MRTISWASLLLSAALVCFLCAGAPAAEPQPPQQPPAAVELPTAQQSPDAPRVWTDVSGKYSRTAVLVEVRSDGVRLRQPSGRHTTIDWDKLSAGDQQYVRDWVDRTSQPLASDPNPSQARTWTDVTGRQATATLVAFRGDLLVLRRPTGKQTTARLNSLSRQDQEFARAFAERTGTAENIAQSGPTHEDNFTARELIEPSAVARAAQPNTRTRLVASSPFPLLPTWDQQSAPARVIHLQVSRRFLDQFIPHEVNSIDTVQDVIVGSPVSGTSTTHGRGSIVLIPSSQQAVADILFSGDSQANTISDSGRAQISSVSTTSFQARKRIVLDATGLHALPTTSTACSNSQTCGICSSLPGLRGAIARRITARRNDDARGQANQEAASHFRYVLNRQLDKDVAKALADVERFQRQFFAAAGQGGLNLQSRCSSTADRLDMAIYRRVPESDQSEPLPPAIPGDPPAALWIHNSFVQQVLADPGLRSALESLAGGFLNPGKPGSPDVASASPSDWKLGWSTDGSWLTLSFELRGQQAASGPAKAPAVGTVAVQSTAP